MDPDSSKKVGLFIINLAMPISILIFVFVIFFMAHEQSWSMVFTIQPEQQVLFLLLTVLSFVNAGLLVAAPRIFSGILNSKENSQDKKLEAATTYQAEVNEHSANHSLFLDYRGDITNGIQSMTIFRFALAESIAIFGFVLSFINQSPLVILPYAFVAVTLQFIFGPLSALIFRNKL